MVSFQHVHNFGFYSRFYYTNGHGVKMSRFGILLHTSRFGTIRRFWRLAIRAIRDSDNPDGPRAGGEAVSPPALPARRRLCAGAFFNLPASRARARAGPPRRCGCPPAPPLLQKHVLPPCTHIAPCTHMNSNCRACCGRCLGAARGSRTENPPESAGPSALLAAGYGPNTPLWAGDLAGTGGEAVPKPCCSQLQLQLAARVRPECM